MGLRIVVRDAFTHFKYITSSVFVYVGMFKESHFLSEKSPSACFFLKDVEGFLYFSGEIMDSTGALWADMHVSLLFKMLFSPAARTWGGLTETEEVRERARALLEALRLCWELCVQMGPTCPGNNWQHVLRVSICSCPLA